MKHLLLFCLLLCGAGYLSCAQSLAVNTDGSTASSSAMLDVKSTTKGLLIPRMSRTERNAIVSPATGLLIFQNAPDSIGFYYYNGSNWASLAGAAADPLAWSTGGNNGTNAATDFMGTTDNQDIVFKRNNIRSGILNARNTSWGTGAFNPAATGTGNAAFGTYALTAATSGNYNMALGDSAMYSNSSGAFNTTIGARAGYDLTTGSSNVFIGYGAGHNVTTASNKLYIGNNSIDPPLIYGDFTSKSIAMGYANDVQSSYGFAVGYQDTVSGFNSIAMGHNNKVTGQSCFAAGDGNYMSPSSNGSFVIGSANNMNATASAIIGQSSTILGNYSFSAGTFNYSSTMQGYTIGIYDSTYTNNTVAIGFVNKVRGSYAMAIGTNNEAPSFGETTMGMMATRYTPSNANSWVGTDRLFTIGNGKFFGAFSDALVLLKNGNLGLGTSTPGSLLDVKGDFSLGANGTVITEIIKQTVTGSIPNMSPNSTTNMTLTVPNVVTGSSVIVSPATVLNTGTVIGYALVSAANTITVYVGNCSGSSVGTQTGVSFYVTVIR